MTATTAVTPTVNVSAKSPPERHRPRVTIGTDGSTWGDAALEWALRHAWLMSAGLRVYSAKSSDDQAIAQRLDVSRWPHASVTISDEAPEHTLLWASRNTDLLVLGHHGHRQRSLGVGHLVLPIASASKCDTVVVRGESRAVRGEHGWITAAVGGQHDEAVIGRATEIATRYRDDLRLVHAWPPPGPRSVATGKEPREVLERARNLVGELMPALAPSLHLVRSQPHEAVQACVRSDLLVMGPGSEAGNLSPITRTALHLAPCPVFVVHP
jgi:nucleotide-binding universal stress UspA family protein